MRIISKFNDYYDSVQKYGQDLNTIYLRKEEFLDYKKFSSFEDLFPVRGYSKGSETFNYTPLLVLINNKVKVGFKLEYKTLGIPDPSVEYCYDIKSCEIFLSKYYPKGLEVFNKKKWDRYSYYSTGPFTSVGVKKFFDTKLPDTQKICIEYSTPVILIGHQGCYPDDRPYDRNLKLTVVKDPCLKTVEFFKAMDTNSTFQEIEGFLTGVLSSSGTPMVTVSEKSKILKHGFDYKLSFRKAPTKKK